MLSRKLSKDARKKTFVSSLTFLFLRPPMNEDVDRTQQEASSAGKKRQWSLADFTMAVIVSLIVLSCVFYFAVENFPKETITIIDIPSQQLNSSIVP